ncbi:nitrilotriacetate monooxygenase component A (plasmid) [Sinorhizobium americanum CCGM7]|nr:nitrilotriacetate monooxygenase component A [Sinorhizobium americanum CCGM7]
MGVGLAGKHADAVFTHAVSLEDNQTFSRRVKQAAVAQGRSPTT